MLWRGRKSSGLYSTTPTRPILRCLLIRLRDKIASHAERSSVTDGGGGRNGVEASRASSPSVRASPFHSTGSFTPRRPTTFPHRRCVQDDLRFFLSRNRISRECSMLNGWLFWLLTATAWVFFGKRTRKTHVSEMRRVAQEKSVLHQKLLGPNAPSSEQ